VGTWKSAQPGKQVEVWFEDEARFGQQGTLTRVWGRRGKRAWALRQTEYEWVYMYGAVCPRTGQAHGWLMPKANTAAMNIFLEDFSRRIAPDTHVVMVCDRAGWHRSKKLNVPANITLTHLPPYSPELNPAELLWREQRSKGLSNRVFKTCADLEAYVAETWMQLESDAQRLHSLCCFPWIESAVSN